MVETKPRSTPKAVQIADWEKTKADVLYYRGDIFTLYVYILEIFSHYDQTQLFLPATLSRTPRLVQILLKFIECGFLIRTFATGKIKATVNQLTLFQRLDELIECPGLVPEHKSRAMTLRVIEGCDWYPDKVEDLQGGPPQKELIDKFIQMTDHAVRILETGGPETGVAAAHYVRAMVRRSLRLSKWQESWEAACNKLDLLDRDDLYFSLQILTDRITDATKKNDAAKLKACIPALEETLNLGEWGKLFYEKWWRNEERNLSKLELWRKVRDEEGLSRPLKPAGWREINMQTRTPVAPQRPGILSSPVTQAQPQVRVGVNPLPQQRAPVTQQIQTQPKSQQQMGPQVHAQQVQRINPRPLPVQQPLQHVASQPQPVRHSANPTPGPAQQLLPQLASTMGMMFTQALVNDSLNDSEVEINQLETNLDMMYMKDNSNW